MRVMFWMERFRPFVGGQETWGETLLPALAARGHEVIVITLQLSPDHPREDRFGRVPVYRFPFHDALKDNDLKRLKALTEEVAALAREFRPGLNHFNFPSNLNPFFFAQTRRAWPAPTLVTLHGATAEFACRRGILGRVFDEVDFVSAVSAAARDEFLAQRPDAAGRSAVVYNGLPLPELKPAPLDLAAPRLLCLGRLSPEKGFDVAIEAFARLRGRFPRARLVVAGIGPLRGELARQAAALGVGEAVEFTGWVSREELPRLINTCALMLVPSRCREGFGLVAVEAAQMARPVVASRVGGLTEVVEDGATGLLVEPEDAAALAAAVARLLDDRAAAGRMGRAARRRALAVFGLDAMADAYAALYRQMAREPAAKEAGA